MKLGKNIYAALTILATGLMFANVSRLCAQGTVTAESLPSAATAATGATITADINIDLSQTSPAQLLGSFSGTLSWNPAVLGFVSHSGVKTGFTGVVGTANTASGQLTFNGANPTGAAGKSNVLAVTFNVIGTNGASTALDLEFSAMTAALTFANLLPILTVTDGAITIMTTSVKDAAVNAEIPTAYALRQNHPNPFSPTGALAGATTVISYELPRASAVHLAIFNVLSQKIRTLINSSLPAGKHTIRWDGTDETGRSVPAGIYIYRLEAGDWVHERKLLKLR
jgi:hypothetical protein